MVTEEPTDIPTQAPTEAPTINSSVDQAVIDKIRSIYIAYIPKESCDIIMDWDKLSEGVISGTAGPTYRKPVDYVDPDCGDGTKPNPYVMHEWTTRRYWGDRDEETLGYYYYQEDEDNSLDRNGVIQTKAREEIAAYDYITSCHTLKIGTYEGKDIYFHYCFLRNIE